MSALNDQTTSSITFLLSQIKIIVFVSPQIFYVQCPFCLKFPSFNSVHGWFLPITYIHHHGKMAPLSHCHCTTQLITEHLPLFHLLTVLSSSILFTRRDKGFEISSTMPSLQLLSMYLWDELTKMQGFSLSNGFFLHQFEVNHLSWHLSLSLILPCFCCFAVVCWPTNEAIRLKTHQMLGLWTHSVRPWEACHQCSAYIYFALQNLSI